jgi:hypothetical protein
MNWKDDLRAFLDLVHATTPVPEQSRDQLARELELTLSEQVYPAFEEFLSEMTRHGIGGQIFGRGSGYTVTLRLDDGFEVAVERDRYREQAHLVPRLIFAIYSEEGCRRCFTTDGISWNRIQKAEVIERLLMEYKRWRLLLLLAGSPTSLVAPR